MARAAKSPKRSPGARAAPAPERAEPLPAWARWGVPLLLAAAVACAFAPAFGAEFLNYDDDKTLVQNLDYRGLSAPHLARMAASARMGHYQPLSWLSFALDHAAWKMDARGYHATNVVLHALTSIALYFVALSLFGRLAPAHARARRAWAAALAAAFFALHPLRVESVAWVTERRDVLSGLFFVLGIGAWLRWTRPSHEADAPDPGRRLPLGTSVAAIALACASVGLFFAGVERSPLGAFAFPSSGGADLALACAAWIATVALAARAAGPLAAGGRTRWYAAACVCVLLSLLAKAWGIVMPAALLVLDLGVLGRGRGPASEPRATPSGPRIAALCLEKLPFVVLSVVFGALAAWAQAMQGEATMKTWTEHGLAERAAQAAYGLAYYPLRTLAPFRLRPIYDLPGEVAFSEARFLGAALLVLAITLALVFLRRRLPWALAAWTLYAVLVSPVLGLAQSGPQLVADRYAYLAGLPFALVLGGAVLAARARSVPATALVALATLTLGACAAATFRYTAVWRNSRALWEHAHALDAESALACQSLGAVRQEEALRESDPARKLELLREALALYERSYGAKPNPELLANQSLVHAEFAELEPARRAEELALALELSRRAIEEARAKGQLTLDYELFHGSHLVKLGRAAEAIPLLQAYVLQKPFDARGFAQLGLALLRAERFADSVRVHETLVRIDPANAQAWGNLALSYEGKGERERAVEAYRKVLALVPGQPIATSRLKALTSSP